MANSQTDLQSIITAIKAQGPPAREALASHAASQESRKRPPRPQKRESRGVDPLAGNIAFGVATAGRRATAELVAKPLVTRMVYLDKPFLIWEWGPGSEPLLDSSIQPFSSWARMYLYAEGGDFSTHLSFYYLWTNEGPEPATITIDAPLVVTGSAFARGSAGFFGGHMTEVVASVSLSPTRWIGWGTNPVNGAPLDQTYISEVQESQRSIITYLNPKGGWGLGKARSSSQNFANEQFNVRATSLLVPAGASLLLQLGVPFRGSTEGDTLEDQAWIDFGSQGNFVSSPYILLTVQTPASAGDGPGLV